MKITLLSGQEIELTKEGIKLLKPKIDEAFAGLDDSEYFRIKKLQGSEIEIELQKMSDGDLYHFAKTNEEFMTFISYMADPFTIKIWKELFKRHNLGYKQVRLISNKQRNLLKELGIKYRQDKPKEQAGNL